MTNRLMIHDSIYQRNMVEYPLTAGSVETAKRELESRLRASCVNWSNSPDRIMGAYNAYGALIYNGTIVSCYCNVLDNSGTLEYTVKFSNALNFNNL